LFFRSVGFVVRRFAQQRARAFRECHLGYQVATRSYR
jgi:hypothetical protein